MLEVYHLDAKTSCIFGRLVAANILQNEQQASSCVIPFRSEAPMDDMPYSLSVGF